MASFMENQMTAYCQIYANKWVLNQGKNISIIDTTIIPYKHHKSFYYNNNERKKNVTISLRYKYAIEIQRCI